MNSESQAAPDPSEWSDCLPPAPAVGALVRTACGGTVQYTPMTPCVFYRGQTVYFCLPICKADAEKDPRHSCLALRTAP
jgi:YHS domain-containing protein